MLASQTASLPAAPRASLVARLTAPRRLLLALSIICCLTIGAQVRAVWQHDGAFYADGETPLGGDLLAFSGAGAIVADGDGAHLYDLERQVAAQVRMLSQDDYDGFLPFAYPAFVAAPYAALARLPFTAAYVVAAAAMLAAALAAVLHLLPVSPTVRERPLLVALAVLASQPLLATIFGGQTVAFSLLCFAGSYAALRRERDLTAGVWLGLLLYKPPLAAPLLLLLLWRRQWRTVAMASAVGLILTLIGVAVAGPGWPWRFLELAGGAFAIGDAAVNGRNMISLLGVAEQLFGTGTAWAWGVAAALSLVAVVVLARAWRGADASGPDFPLQFGLAIAVTLLLSPHALYYETSLLILPIIALVDRWRTDAHGLTATRRLGLVGLFAAGFAWQLGTLVGVHPLSVLPVIVAFLTWQALWSDERPAPTGPGRLAQAGRAVWGELPTSRLGKALTTGLRAGSRLQREGNDTSSRGRLWPLGTGKTTVTTVGIVENHRAFGERLETFVRDQLGCTVVGIAADADAGVELVRRTKPDVVLVEVALPGGNGVGIVDQLREVQPALQVVLMGDLDSRDYTRAAADAGALAYVPKTAVGEQLPALLGKTVGGEVAFFNDDHLDDGPDAGERETAVLPMLRRGLVLEGALAGGTLASGLALNQPAAAFAGATGIVILSRWQSARARDRRGLLGTRLPWRQRRGR